MNKSRLRFSVGGRCDTGPVRTANDDYLIVDLALGLCMALDAGGSWAENGGEASRIGGEVIQRVLRETPLAIPPHLRIEQAFTAAGTALRARTDENGWWGAASIAFALLEGGQAHITWLGDAAVYRVSDNQIEALTWTHTILNVMQRQGTWTEEIAAKDQGWSRVLMNALGSELPNPLEIISFTPNAGERLILTTDGVHDVLANSDFLAACQSHSEPQACANHLVELARERGSRDNCTCVVIAFTSPGRERP